MKKLPLNAAQKIILVAGAGLAMGAGLGLFIGYDVGYEKAAKSSSSEVKKLKVCPESWIFDKMPGVGERSDATRQYFIIKGDKVAYEDMDITWVKSNCEVNRPQEVY